MAAAIANSTMRGANQPSRDGKGAAGVVALAHARSSDTYYFSELRSRSPKTLANMLDFPSGPNSILHNRLRTVGRASPHSGANWIAPPRTRCAARIAPSIRDE